MPAAPPADVVWKRMDALIDRANEPTDLAEHRLGALAAARLRAQGRFVPEALVQEERIGLMASVAAPAALARARDILDEPIVVVKGPVLAALYAAPHLRAYADLDLVVADVAQAQRRLIAAGAAYALGEPAPPDRHHARELMLPGLPIAIELHRFPSWPTTGRPPQAPELLELAGPSVHLPAGVLALPPPEHAVLVAAHSWAHRPLRRLRDLLEVALLAAQGSAEDALDSADRWGVSRIWQTTLSAVAAIFSDPGEPTLPWPLRSWARDLVCVRRRSLAETAMEHAVAQFWATRPLPAARDGGRRLARAALRRAVKHGRGRRARESDQ